MKKILYGLIAAVCFGIAATAGAAGQRCLNNDPNYPMSYGHANWWEYVDLSSVVGGGYDGEYYQFAPVCGGLYIKTVQGLSRHYMIIKGVVSIYSSDVQKG